MIVSYEHKARKMRERNKWKYCTKTNIKEQLRRKKSEGKGIHAVIYDSYMDLTPKATRMRGKIQREILHGTK